MEPEKGSLLGKVRFASLLEPRKVGSWILAGAWDGPVMQAKFFFNS